MFIYDLFFQLANCFEPIRSLFSFSTAQTEKKKYGKNCKTNWGNYLMNSFKEQMEAAFAKFDKDKTGRINYTEFCTMLNKNNK